eukprot:COSAG01_NODE_29749_length_630_cov_1.499058_1_plen_37_part_01
MRLYLQVVAIYGFLIMPIRDEEAQDEDKIERRRNMWR